MRRLLITLAFLIFLGLLASLLLREAERPRTSDSDFLRPSVGPVLFLDSKYIAEAVNVRSVVEPALRYPGNPIVTSGPGHKNWQPWLTVLHQSDGGPTFRMWYNAFRDPSRLSNITSLAYLESEDGFRWAGPFQSLISADPVTFGARVIDRGKDVNFDRRFALFYYVVEAAVGQEKAGIWVAFSRDGKEWSPHPSNPVLPSVTDDIVNVFYDDARQRYVMMLKLYREFGWTSAEGEAKQALVRLVGIAQSDDMLSWSEPEVLFVPDEEDSGITEWYGTAAIQRRGDLWVGFLKVSRDDLNLSGDIDMFGRGYTVLIWSRDGLNWHRDREDAVFLGPDPNPDAWDHSHAWIDSAVRVGDEIFLYYGGYRSGHKSNRFEDRQIGLARMALDRYRGFEAGLGGGALETRTFIFPGLGLTVNANPLGGIDVQITDASGKPVPGFSYSECQDIEEDSVRAAVSCKGALAELMGRPVRIAMKMPAGSKVFSVHLQ